MTTIRTRAGKGSALSHNELDANFKQPVVTKASNYSLTAAHNREVHELANGVIATLPTASAGLTETGDWRVTLKAMGSSGATIATGGQSVDGSTSNITLAQYESVTIAMNATGTGFLKTALGGTTFVTLTGTETLTNKTLTSPTINSAVVFSSEVDNGNSGAADTIDWTLGNKQRSTLTDNATFTFTAPPGPCNLVLKLIQDGTGSRNPVWPATVKWAGGVEPSWSTTAGAIDIVSFYYDGTNYFGAALRGFV